YDRLTNEKSIPSLRHIPIGSNIKPELAPDYNRTVWRTALGFQPDEIVVGYFGFLNASKGIETLLQGAKIARSNGLNIKLLMIGGRTGSSDPTNYVYAQEIDQMIEDLSLQEHLRWTGFVDGPEVSAHLAACDLLALPYRDGVSFRRGSLMAALAHGCTIITTHPEVDTPELVGDQHVRLIAPDSPTNLAVAIEDLADNPDLRHEMGENARKLADQFAWEKIAARTAEYFEELCGGA
ncbi:MAG: glycosyltransferase, partial [Chloroflexi bacterium]|nr:glycosyltransferase [Chloroflexota bacterium]